LDIDPGGIVVIFAKNLEKKLLTKEIILKKGKNINGVGSKIRNKLCIKNEVFHVCALNKTLMYKIYALDSHTCVN